MNKKKLGTGLVALALVGVVGVGGSLAWFTDTESKTNTFTTGKVDITLTEYYNDVEQQNGITYDNVMPGDTLNKKVEVTLNEDSQDAWVRLALTLETTNQHILNALADENDDNDIMLLDADGTAITVDWTVDGGKATAIYDVDTKLTKANSKWIPFTDVKIPESWGNDFAKAEFKLNVKAEAIQSENNNDGFDEVSSADIEVFE